MDRIAWGGGGSMVASDDKRETELFPVCAAV